MANTHCKVKNGATGKAVAHANYISALGKYQAKEGEVVLLLSGNMPSFAVENPTDFWVASDEFGQASYTAIHKRKADGHQILDGVKIPFSKGDPYEKTFHSRAYKEIEFSIPREIDSLDKQKKFAQEFAMRIAGKTQPFTLAVHNTIALDGLPNCHAHLMLSEKMIDGVERERDLFFKKPSMPYRHRVTKELIAADPAKGGAVKNRAMHEIDFVKGVRETYQAQAKNYGVELDMRSNKEQWLGEPEPKLGPIHPRTKDNTAREIKQQTINQIRQHRKENEQRTAASLNRIGANLATAGRYVAVADRAITAAGKNHQSLEPTSGRIEQAARTYGRSRAAQAVVETVGRVTGQIVREITRAAEGLAAYVKRTEKPLEAIETIETVKSTIELQKSLTERIAESLEAFILWVKGKDNGKLKEINLERSDNIGRIEQISDYHAIQYLGLGNYVIHELDKIDLKPQLKDMATIKYRDGSGTVQIDRARGLDLGR